MMTPKPGRTFGLVAGLGVGAGIFYYKTIVERHLALGMSAQLVMVHADVRRVMAMAAARQTVALADYLAGLLSQLKKGGADLACIPAFSPQVCANELAATTPLPLVSLLDVIVSEVQKRQLRRVALFGARVTMETKLFGRLPDVDVVSPQPGEFETIASIYVRVVEAARASEEDFRRLRYAGAPHLHADSRRAFWCHGLNLCHADGWFRPGCGCHHHVDQGAAFFLPGGQQLAEGPDARQAPEQGGDHPGRTTIQAHLAARVHPVAQPLDQREALVEAAREDYRLAPRRPAPAPLARYRDTLEGDTQRHVAAQPQRTCRVRAPLADRWR